MKEEWRELKETIMELRDNNGSGTQQEVCKFLANLMDVLEKQMQEPCVVNMKDLSDDELKKFEEVMKKVRVQVIQKEPCDDAISRQAVLDLCDSKDPEYKVIHFKEDVECLPSVTPQQKIGHWIEDAKTYYEELNKRGLGVDEYTPYFTDDIACSVCLAKYSMLDNETQFFKYCPNCGAKMESEEDKK